MAGIGTRSREDLKRQWSVSVNANWRLTFAFEGEDAILVDYLDYHSGASTMTTMHNPASPGELLREFLGNRTATELAGHIGVARATISRILNGRSAVTVDLSIRLGQALALSPDFFSKAQLQYDLWIESQRSRPTIKPLAA